MVQDCGMIILTGAAPQQAGTAGPRDRRVGMATDIVALVERAMLDPKKLKAQGRPLPASGVQSLSGDGATAECSVVHLRNGNQLVVQEGVDEVCAMIAMAKHRAAQGDYAAVAVEDVLIMSQVRSGAAA